MRVLLLTALVAAAQSATVDGDFWLVDNMCWNAGAGNGGAADFTTMAGVKLHTVACMLAADCQGSGFILVNDDVAEGNPDKVWTLGAPDSVANVAAIAFLQTLEDDAADVCVTVSATGTDCAGAENSCVGDDAGTVTEITFAACAAPVVPDSDSEETPTSVDADFHLVDNMCWDKGSGDNGDFDTMVGVKAHTVHCMLVQGCQDSGYILVNDATTKGTPEKAFDLDADGDAAAIKFLKTLEDTQDDICVSVTGKGDGAGNLTEAKFAACGAGGDDDKDATEASSAVVASATVALLTMLF